MKRTILTMLIASTILSGVSPVFAGDFKLVDTSSRTSWKTRGMWALGAVACIGGYYLGKKALNFGNKVSNWTAVKWIQPKVNEYLRPNNSTARSSGMATTLNKKQPFNFGSWRLRNAFDSAIGTNNELGAREQSTGSYLWKNRQLVKAKMKEDIAAGVIVARYNNYDTPAFDNPNNNQPGIEKLSDSVDFLTALKEAIGREAYRVLQWRDTYAPITSCSDEESSLYDSAISRARFDNADKQRMNRVECSFKDFEENGKEVSREFAVPAKSHLVSPEKMNEFYRTYDDYFYDNHGNLKRPNKKSVTATRWSTYSSWLKKHIPTFFDDPELSLDYINLQFVVGRLLALEAIVQEEINRVNGLAATPSAPAPNNAAAARVRRTGIHVLPPVHAAVPSH